MSKTLNARVRPAAPTQVDTRPTLLFFFRAGITRGSRRFLRVLAGIRERSVTSGALVRDRCGIRALSKL
jgi:hypothetical protein